jgi:hypothetical protein
VSVAFQTDFPRRFLATVGVGRAAPGIFENQGAAIIEGDFLGTPCRALVETVWVGITPLSALSDPLSGARKRPTPKANS